MARIGQTKASMLQDLEKGAVTEVDVINGGVVENAKRVNLPSPNNSSVVEIVHSCENDKLMPGVSNLTLMGELAGGL
jgi:2-dehydropantoate 2-reductase